MTTSGGRGCDDSATGASAGACAGTAETASSFRRTGTKAGKADNDDRFSGLEDFSTAKSKMGY
jgi:hypothetical protein